MCLSVTFKCNYNYNYKIIYTDTLLVVRLVRKRNSEELDEQSSCKRQRIDADEGM